MYMTVNFSLYRWNMKQNLHHFFEMTLEAKMEGNTF